MEKDFKDSIKIKNFEQVNLYMKKFEKNEITEEEIPEEYRRVIRQRYIQKIQELRQIKKYHNKLP